MHLQATLSSCIYKIDLVPGPAFILTIMDFLRGLGGLSSLTDGVYGISRLQSDGSVVISVGTWCRTYSFNVCVGI